MKGSYVVIHYDPLTPEYEGTDARVLEERMDLGCMQMFKLQRFDGTTAWYSENYVKNYSDVYETLEDTIPDLPLCKCPIRTPMMRGCQCGGI